MSLIIAVILIVVILCLKGGQSIITSYSDYEREKLSEMRNEWMSKNTDPQIKEEVEAYIRSMGWDEMKKKPTSYALTCLRNVVMTFI